MAEEARKRLPLFVFLPRQFERPLSERFGLELANTTKSYILLGTASLLSIPLVIIVLKTLWKIWVEMNWLSKTIFCIICPPLLILVVLQFLIKRFHR